MNKTGVNMVWFEKEVLNAAKIILKDASKEIAKDVMNDAKRILKQKAKTTTDEGLLDQFDIIPSKYDETSFIVWCQGPRNWRPPYHASFLEMGTYKDEAKPYLRPARKKNLRKARKLYKDALK